MSRKTLAIGLIVIGIIVIIVALGAGYIGLSHSTTLGTNKLILAGAGLVCDIVGVVLMVQKKA